MQLDWIDDILAVIDTGSLTRAAERRFLTQSAFTRRVRLIEERISVPLFDRSCKPVTILPGVQAMEPELRELGARLRRLQHDLKAAADGAKRDVTFVCQHAITTTISPWVVRQLTQSQDISVRVRSGNRDNCLMLLLSGEADFAMTYEQPDAPGPALPQAFEMRRLGGDTLVPVASPDIAFHADAPEIPFISYPPDVFLGRLFSQSILPLLREGVMLSPKAETALTLAACEYALDGIGVAWLPLTLVKRHITEGRLRRLHDLPHQNLSIMLIRLSDQQGDGTAQIWSDLTNVPDPSVGL